MPLIWFNPEERSYHTGDKVDYDVQKSLSRFDKDFMILDRLEEGKMKLAMKIVNRLNQAYHCY